MRENDLTKINRVIPGKSLLIIIVRRWSLNGTGLKEKVK